MVTTISKRIPVEVLAALDQGFMIDGLFQMPQLDGNLYPKVKKVLTALGIIWKPKLKGHICEDGDDPMERIEDAIQTKCYEKPNRLEFFRTPPEVVARIIEYLDLDPSEHHLLEPSAGDGAIADACAKILKKEHLITCIDIDHKRTEALWNKGYRHVYTRDFLGMMPDKDLVSSVASSCGLFPRIAMNPPFRAQADIDHVSHAYEHWLAPGGKLVAVMSASTDFRKTGKAIAFRSLLDEVGMMEDLPEDSFKSSGTRVGTILVVMDKPEGEEPLHYNREEVMTDEPLHRGNQPKMNKRKEKKEETRPAGPSKGRNLSEDNQEQPPRWMKHSPIAEQAWKSNEGFRNRAREATGKKPLESMCLEDATRFSHLNSARTNEKPCGCDHKSCVEKARVKGHSTRFCWDCNHTVIFAVDGAPSYCQ